MIPGSTKSTKSRGLYRILDANLNRSREGLRVCEDICRFVLSDRKLSLNLKIKRHRITSILKTLPLNLLLDSRNPVSDPGAPYDIYERKRNGWMDIYFANIERVKESLRVLEETCKLIKPSAAGHFKKIRFNLYSHEKNCLKKFKSLCNSGS